MGGKISATILIRYKIINSNSSRHSHCSCHLRSHPGCGSSAAVAALEVGVGGHGWGGMGVDQMEGGLHDPEAEVVVSIQAVADFLEHR